MAGASDGVAEDVGPFDDDTGDVTEGAEGAGTGTSEGGEAAVVPPPAPTGDTLDATDDVAPGAGVAPSRPSRASRPSRTDAGAASSEAEETGPAIACERTASRMARCVTTARQSWRLHESFALSMPAEPCNDLDLATRGATLGSAP